MQYNMHSIRAVHIIFIIVDNEYQGHAILLSMTIRKFFAIAILVVAVLFRTGSFAYADSAQLLFTPSSGNFLTNSTFDVSLILNTGNQTINVVDVTIEFPADKIQVVSPSTGKSFVSLWVQQPTFSNKTGTLHFVGGVPAQGIRTSNGLISTITFRAKTPGLVTLKIRDDSSVLAADGQGSIVPTLFGRAQFSITAQAPQGPKVFSVTHPDSNTWYNNNNVIMGWDTEDGVSGYSYDINQEPSKVPDNIDETSSTSASFSNLDDGIWYFHIKQKRVIYGDVSHYQVKIDTGPPAEFKPTVSILTAAIATRKAYITFITTDALSGINHYEIAVFDPSKESGEQPVFVEATSPYQISNIGTNNTRIIVRAFDNAGNVRDGIADISGLNSITTIFKNYGLALTLIFLFSAVIFIIIHIWRDTRKNMTPATYTHV